MLQRLTRQLSGYYLVVLALALGVFAFGSLEAARTVMVQGIDEDNHRLLRPAAQLFASGKLPMKELFHEFTEFSLEPGERAAVLAPDGRVLYARGASIPGGRLPPVPGPSTDGELRAYTLPFTRLGQPVGFLYVASTLAHVHAALRAMCFGFAACAPLLLLFAGLAGRALALRAARPVEESLQRERAFTRDASHELRTPLAAAQLEVQLALRAPGLPPEVAERLGRVDGAVRRMGELVAALLALASGEAGQGMRSLRFSLAELVEEQAEALNALAEARGTTLEVLLPAGDAPVQGDPAQLGGAVCTLIDNAIRYAPAGSRVVVKLSSDGARHVLAVSSPGRPLEGEERAHVFERFGRTQAGRAANPEGAGLGLAIARAVATSHGGGLELLPPKAEGNTFALTVPAARA